jgi:CRP-like cAMP-binding protein
MDISTLSPNRLLASLSPSDLDLVGPHMRDFELVHGAVLAVAGEDLKQAHFPHSGVISLVVRLIQGETAEVAMVGRGSVYGSSAALSGPAALITGIVESPGTCTVIPSRFLRAAADRSPTFRTTMTQHAQAIFVQAQQSAGCIASHSASSRLARWLLRARDASGSDEFQFTQEFMGQMLGVQRNAVSQVAGTLQDKGLIKFSRAHIRITDVAGLKAAACECYETVEVEMEQRKHGTRH